MLMAYGYLRCTLHLAGKRQDAHEPPRQNLEHVFIKCGADFDLEPRLLTHFALQRRAMILARIEPAARQVPFAALIQEQEHVTVVDEDPLHRERQTTHRSVAVP